MKPHGAATAEESLQNIEALKAKLLRTYLPGLRDDNPRIRRKAARGLGFLGAAAAAAVPALDALQEDDNAAVRGAARWALSRITGVTGTPPSGGGSVRGPRRAESPPGVPARATEASSEAVCLGVKSGSAPPRPA